MRSLRLTALVAVLFLAAAGAAHAQGVGINSTGAAADTSAILDLSATNKGLLVPRMTAAQRAAIVLPANGLVVYQTDGTTGLYCNAGTSGAPNWQLVGSNAAGGQWSASGSNLYYTSGKVAVGTTPGAYRFWVQDTGLVLRVQANNTNSVMASFGGAGQIQVDAPGVVGGRMNLLDNGYLGLGRTTPATRLDVLGGNSDATSGEGDVRIGNGTYRMKLGVATAGGGAGGATLMQHGVAGGYNVLALGAQGNKVAYVNGNTQRLGIGTDVPAAPLGFAAALGKKVVLYPGVSNDYGLGIASGRLQIFSDGTPGGDVAIGTDAAGTFTERFAVKNTGAIAVAGSTGAAGQVLQSNGSGAPATWVSPTRSRYDNVYSIASTAVTTVPTWTGQPLPDLTKTVTVTGNAKIVIDYALSVEDPECVLCAGAPADGEIWLNGTRVRGNSIDLENGGSGYLRDHHVVSVGAGTHTIQVYGHSNAKASRFGNTSTTYGNALHVEVIPQ